ncbi:MAG: amidohydrolase family protein [Bacteroidetes bacterium]|nr:MAG: amidohydrolase family protein [Bacteroidota bacterium]
MGIYNCHTHIFTLACVPNRAMGVPLANWISGDRVGRAIAKFANWVTPNSPKRSLGRYLTFAEIGLSATQKNVFDDLLSVYKEWGTVKFVVLPMDMEQMGAGLPNKIYRDQLKEIIDIRKNNSGYADILLPFLFVDPNRFSNGDAVLNFVRDYIEVHGFVGIKLYPAVGYYPFDEKLDKMYGYAEQHQIPILTHCTQGPTYYRGNLDNKRNPRFRPDYLDLKSKDNDDFQRNFTDPRNYRYVLDTLGFRNLKINLAHYGGADSMLGRSKKNNGWYPEIKQLMAEFPNVYTDISYTLYNTDDDFALYKKLLADLNDPAIGNKILFGTDFYVTTPAKPEDKLRDEFYSFLVKNNSEPIFDKITQTVPQTYLTSDFYVAD